MTKINIHIEYNSDNDSSNGLSEIDHIGNKCNIEKMFIIIRLINY